MVLSNSVGYPVKRDHYYGLLVGISDVQNPQAYVRLHHGSTSQNSANVGWGNVSGSLSGSDSRKQSLVLSFVEKGDAPLLSEVHGVELGP